MNLTTDNIFNTNIVSKEALEIIYKDSCTALKTPTEFTEVYSTIGDVLIPFFFKEELPDPLFIYTSCANNNTKTTQPANKSFWEKVKEIAKNFKEPMEYS